MVTEVRIVVTSAGEVVARMAEGYLQSGVVNLG